MHLFIYTIQLQGSFLSISICNKYYLIASIYNSYLLFLIYYLSIYYFPFIIVLSISICDAIIPLRPLPAAPLADRKRGLESSISSLSLSIYILSLSLSICISLSLYIYICNHLPLYTNDLSISHILYIGPLPAAALANQEE